MELHAFPIPIPPPTSLSTRFLWVFPMHQARALVSCIQPGLVICFTLDNIHVLMLFSQNIPPLLLNFRIILSNSKKNLVGILIRTTLNLYIKIPRINSFLLSFLLGFQFIKIPFCLLIVFFLSFFQYSFFFFQDKS